MFNRSNPDKQRPQARRIARALATPAVLGALGATLLTTPAPAAHTPVGNATFPGSNYRCSDGQKTFLKSAWQEAYSYTKRAEQMIDYIAAQPTEDDRRRLWEQDFRGYGSSADWLRTASPQRYFGAYDRERLGRVQSALDDARRRFEGKTMYLITCSTVCPKESSTSAHHAVKGRVVTCEVFWSRARDKSLTAAEQLGQSAFTLAHEVFHHIFVKVDGVWAAVGDYHGDGVGGHTDQKYYGIENVTYLAREKANWAVRNNDSYAYFAQAANGNAVGALHRRVRRQGGLGHRRAVPRHDVGAAQREEGRARERRPVPRRRRDVRPRQAAPVRGAVADRRRRRAADAGRGVRGSRPPSARSSASRI